MILILWLTLMGLNLPMVLSYAKGSEGTKNFDGMWNGQEDGTFQGTIKGNLLTSSIGEQIELTFDDESYVHLEYDGETIRGHITPAGLLEWSDGGIWIRQGSEEATNNLKNGAANAENVDASDFIDSDGITGNLEMYDYGEDFDCGNVTDNGSACESGEYECYSGKCIPQLYVCNGINDCGDMSDEQGCGCKPDEFTCDNLDCIPLQYKCNSFTDCSDGSDEKEEMCRVCDDTTEWTCDNGDCIDLTSLCDETNDCSDMSDESGCIYVPAICSSGQYSCKNGNCISMAQKCNGENNCGDSSDEEHCTCESDEFKCDNGNCINEKYYCNTADNCGDGSDEIGCQCEPPHYLACKDGSCYAAEYQCNNNNDCGDWSDEEDCPCYSNEFTCSNGICIDAVDQCDDNNDCGDWSDEQGCGNCNEGELLCNNGNCINEKYVCDGSDNCGDATDEENCGGCAWSTWEATGTCSEPCGVGQQTMARSESPWGVYKDWQCTTTATKSQDCIMSGCTAMDMDNSVEDGDMALLYIDEELAYTMEYEFGLQNDTDEKTTTCDRFDLMFEARPSILTTPSGRGELVYSECAPYTSGTSRRLVSRALRDEGHKRKKRSVANLQTFTRMKRRTSERTYAEDTNEKSYKEYENHVTMRGAETGIKGFSEVLPAKTMSLENGGEEWMKQDFNRDSKKADKQVPFAINMNHAAVLAREDALSKGPKKQETPTQRTP